MCAWILLSTSHAITIISLSSSPLGSTEGICCPLFADVETEAQEHRCGFANHGSQGSVLGSTVLSKHYAKGTCCRVLLASCPGCLMSPSALAVPALSDRLERDISLCFKGCLQHGTDFSSPAAQIRLQSETALPMRLALKTKDSVLRARSMHNSQAS